MLAERYEYTGVQALRQAGGWVWQAGVPSIAEYVGSGHVGASAACSQ